ncbi:MAG: amino acid ABC transporter permease [Clostridia bacterium]|jgi:glutamine transport system permease protein|nr:amino acid ABC transporter permease [Clostridia bacterium]NLS85615.1 amino acid ABC transporter permease [Oscillospiraceae bacterium]
MDFLTVVKEASPMLFSGMGITILVTVYALVIAFILGIAACLMCISDSKVLNLISRFYVWVIRGTPFIVQLFIIYFGIPQLIQSLGASGFRMTSMQAAVITLSLNAGAYMAEIFRGGIQAVDIGQMEAARSLALPKWTAMRKVILPQAVRICIPSLGNQFIITLKDSSLAQVIGLAEIVYQGKIYVGRTMQSFSTYLLIGIFYLVLISILQFALSKIEKRLALGRRT